jgi:hypothetical protein
MAVLDEKIFKMKKFVGGLIIVLFIVIRSQMVADNLLLD